MKKAVYEVCPFCIVRTCELGMVKSENNLKEHKKGETQFKILNPHECKCIKHNHIEIYKKFLDETQGPKISKSNNGKSKKAACIATTIGLGAIGLYAWKLLNEETEEIDDLENLD